MNNLEKPLKALANRRRLAIIKLLKNRREASVGEIADHIKLSMKATSKHLVILSANDIVQREQRSSQMFYSLSVEQKPVVSKVLTIL